MHEELEVGRWTYGNSREARSAGRERREPTNVQRATPWPRPPPSPSIRGEGGTNERMGETCDTQSKLLNSLHATIRIYVASTLDLHHKWHAATSFNSEKHMGRVHVKKDTKPSS